MCTQYRRMITLAQLIYIAVVSSTTFGVLCGNNISIRHSTHTHTRLSHFNPIVVPQSLLLLFAQVYSYLTDLSKLVVLYIAHNSPTFGCFILCITSIFNIENQAYCRPLASTMPHFSPTIHWTNNYNRYLVCCWRQLHKWINKTTNGPGQPHTHTHRHTHKFPLDHFAAAYSNESNRSILMKS